MFKILWWLLPVFFLLWVYREGLLTWFLADDFAWLSLLHRVQIRHDLFTELFAPAAQGTIRPWSERGYFLLLEALFGLDSLPFRIVAFATAIADVLLIAWTTLRATGSRIAGFVAPIFWIANTALVRAMTWSAAYNELMCLMFLLGALVLLIRYLDTGDRRFWWWQLVVFSLGFGALEINIVYPAIAAAWILFLKSARRHLLRDVAPAACISVGYFAIHRLVAPLPAGGAYALRFDASILKTLALYWKWSLVPEPMVRFAIHSQRGMITALVAASIAILIYTVVEIVNRRLSVLFFWAWFAATLTPVLPLVNHRTDYYLTIPVAGIAMLGAAAFGQHLASPLIPRAIAVIPVVLYLWTMIPTTRTVTHWWLVKSLAVRTLVLGAEAAHETHPGKAIVLDGVGSELFDLSLAHSPFIATGFHDVYLTPGSELTIQSESDSVDLDPLVLEPEAMWHGITHDEVVVYSLKSDRLRNITEAYTRRLAGTVTNRLPSRIDAGNFLYSWILGPTWLPPESGIRWMPGSAVVRIGVPTGGSRLELQGRCPSTQLSVTPRHLMVLVDGVVAADTRIYDPERDFRRLFPIPEVLAGKTSVEIEIRVDPVDRSDGQDYGLVFGKIAIRP